jgi:hypothetical protein
MLGDRTKQLIAAAIILFVTSSASGKQISITGFCDVYFTPPGGATTAIIKLIEGAQRSIRVLAYRFTSPKSPMR